MLRSAGQNALPKMHHFGRSASKSAVRRLRATTSASTPCPGPSCLTAMPKKVPKPLRETRPELDRYQPAPREPGAQRFLPFTRDGSTRWSAHAQVGAARPKDDSLRIRFRLVPLNTSRHLYVPGLPDRRLQRTREFQRRAGALTHGRTLRVNSTTLAPRSHIPALMVVKRTQFVRAPPETPSDDRVHGAALPRMSHWPATGRSRHRFGPRVLARLRSRCRSLVRTVFGLAIAEFRWSHGSARSSVSCTTGSRAEEFAHDAADGACRPRGLLAGRVLARAIAMIRRPEVALGHDDGGAVDYHVASRKIDRMRGQEPSLQPSSVPSWIPNTADSLPGLRASGCEVARCRRSGSTLTTLVRAPRFVIGSRPIALAPPGR